MGRAQGGSGDGDRADQPFASFQSSLPLARWRPAQSLPLPGLAPSSRASPSFLGCSFLGETSAGAWDRGPGQGADAEAEGPRRSDPSSSVSRWVAGHSPLSSVPRRHRGLLSPSPHLVLSPPGSPFTHGRARVSPTIREANEVDGQVGRIPWST